ncbi:MAG: 4-hydroxy-tetrahydrodipicolinate reductase, partial [Acholeplasmataceae bacterium]|nr:4-hydroxy-tetrahydrodipicolinate reductase [Acholeplasmataceae bacterium]
MKILIIGSKGKMGALVKSTLEKESLYYQVFGYDQNEINTEMTFNSFSSLPIVDVIIDFSHPSLLKDILFYAQKNATPLVIATTGYTKEQEKEIAEVSQKLPIFKSSNYSFGVEVMSQALKLVSSYLEADYDIEIIEKHHHLKIDAPSGTSLHLANIINDALKTKKEIVNGHIGKRSENELAIHAIRGGSVVGEHTVMFLGQ